tara:strand:+ start:5215 stop:5979 length:765 start_codon:yes stop_codon:yes gene_type:complete
MIEKVKTIFWFLKNPKYSSQIIQVLKRIKNFKLEKSRTESTKWCELMEVSQDQALDILFKSKVIESLKEQHKKHYIFAKEKERICPLEMGGEGAVDFIYTLTKLLVPENIIETGVAYGWSSLAILLAIKNHNNSKLISNDMPYIKMNNDEYVGTIISNDLKKKWDLQRLADVKGIPLALKKFNYSIDMVHYDSDKSYTARIWASSLIWKYLNKNGIFISDDINDNLAFKHFCDSIGKTPIIFKHKCKFVGLVKK